MKLIYLLFFLFFVSTKNLISAILHNEVVNENSNFEIKSNNEVESNLDNSIINLPDLKEDDSPSLSQDQVLPDPQEVEPVRQTDQANEHEKLQTEDVVTLATSTTTPSSTTSTTTSSSSTSTTTVSSTTSTKTSSTTTTTTTQGPETSTQIDTKTQASIVAGVVVNKAEMESFEEWKEMKLKDAAKQHAEAASAAAVNKQASSQSGHSTTSTSNSNTPASTVTQVSKENSLLVPRRKNYASLDCGAKIIGYNRESSSPWHVLTESKDDYMLNSCSSRVWFVIELCEPIKINEIQLANFELFSNVPRQFKVYASERYIQPSNSNNWPVKYLLGTFEAANSRSLQSFSIKDSFEFKHEVTLGDLANENVENKIGQQVIMYAKYVKFEMISHYGNEHFCPLSLVRVFGTSIADDEEVAHEVSHEVDVDVKVANVEETRIELSNNFEKLILVEKNSSIENHRGIEKPKFIDFSTTFLSNLISVLMGENFNLKIFFSDSNSQSTQNKIIQNNLNQLKSRPSKSTQILSNSKTPIITLQTNETKHEQRNLALQSDLPKLLCFTCLSFNFDCCQCFKPSIKTSNNKTKFESARSSFNHFIYSSESNPMPSYCVYYYLMATTSQTRSKSSLLSRYLSNIRSDLPDEEKQLNTNYTQILINKMNYFILNEWLDNRTLSLSLGNFTKFNTNISNDTKLNLNQNQEETKNITLIEEINQGESHLKKEENKLYQDSEISSEKNPEKSEVIETTESIPNTIEPTSTSKLDTTNQSDLSTTDNSQPPTVSSQAPSPPITEPQQSQTQATTTPQTTSNPSSTVTVPQHVPQVVTPIVIANGKDAVFMRLNNRIKMLELNMSLSSQYLEKLSQHYRKQMDEMQKAFNLTTSALIETIRVADERDLKQNEKIILIEKKIEKMQSNIESLETFLDDLKFQSNIVIWTIIIMLNTIIAIEILRCIRNSFRKKGFKQPDYYKAISAQNDLIKPY